LPLQSELAISSTNKVQQVRRQDGWLREDPREPGFAAPDTSGGRGRAEW